MTLTHHLLEHLEDGVVPHALAVALGPLGDVAVLERGQDEPQGRGGQRLLGLHGIFQGVAKTGTQHGWSRSEEHTSELQSLMRISYAVFCLKKKKRINSE